MQRFVPIALITLTSLACGQQFASIGKRHLPRETVATFAVLADIDGDGDEDLISSAYPDNRVFVNGGRGRFTLATGRLPKIPDLTYTMAAGDIDADGDVDLVFSNWHGTRRTAIDRVLINDGSGRFRDETATRLSGPATDFRFVHLIDVDGDKDLDLLWIGLQNGLHLNDGKGVFRDVTAARLPALPGFPAYATVGDIDGDGDVDALVGTLNPNHNVVLRNDGRGKFATDTTRVSVRNGDAALALGDLDGDKDLDLVVGNGFEADRLYLNDGKGGFQIQPPTRLPNPAAATGHVELVDADGDGDLDVMLCRVRSYSRGTRTAFYRNDGKATFTDATRMLLPADRPDANFAISGDVDRDGRADLVTIGVLLKLYVQQRAGGYADASRLHLPESDNYNTALALADFDADGDLDLIFGGGSPTRRNVRAPYPQLYRNDGSGRFTDRTRSAVPPDSFYTLSIATGDVDGDGTEDVVFGNRGTQAQLWLNNGNATFRTGLPLPPDSDITYAIALVDIDADNDLDLVLGNNKFGPFREYPAQNRLYLNDGRGKFSDATTTWMPSVEDYTSHLVTGDLDGDGDVDLLVFPGPKLYRNTGKKLVEATSGNIPTPSATLALGELVDIDGDNDLDLVAANHDPRGHRIELFRNDGRGKFSLDPKLPIVEPHVLSLVIVDLDSDGDRDIVMAPSHKPLTWLANDGTGRFSIGGATYLPDTIALPWKLAFGDIDGDLDPDLAIAGGSLNELALNRTRQSTVPFLVRLRDGLTIEHSVRPGTATSPSFVQSFLSLGSLPRPVRIPDVGTWRLDPSLMIGLGTVPVPFPSGRATTFVPLPQATALVGLPIYTQSLVFETRNGLTLAIANMTVDRIID